MCFGDSTAATPPPRGLLLTAHLMIHSRRAVTTRVRGSHSHSSTLMNSHEPAVSATAQETCSLQTDTGLRTAELQVSPTLQGTDPFVKQ